MTTTGRDRDDDDKDETDDDVGEDIIDSDEGSEFVPEITFDQFQPILTDWYDEVTGTGKARKGWFAIKDFDGDVIDPELVIKSDDLDSEETSDDKVTEVMDSDSKIGNSGIKSNIIPGNQNFVENYVWRKLQKYAVICTIPHITQGYAVENDERQGNQGDREIVIKVPFMIDFWEGGAGDPDSFPPEDNDTIRVLYYLLEHWDAYDDPSETGVDTDDILKVDPKGALVFALAGRHMRLESPSVVFKKIEPGKDDHGRSYLSIEGEITGQNMEIYDRMSLRLELTALLRMLTLSSCLEKTVYDKLLTPEKGEAWPPYTPEDRIKVPIEFIEDENKIEFSVNFGPLNPGGKRDIERGER